MPTLFNSGEASTVRACVARFRLAWASGQRPQLSDSLPSGETESRNLRLRRETLLALIPVDMEYRWQGTTPRSQSSSDASRPLTLADYTAQFPELGSLETLPLELFEVEFLVRRRSGDSSTLDDFARQYGLSTAQRRELESRLSRFHTASTSSGAEQSVTQTFNQPTDARRSQHFSINGVQFGPYRIVGLIGSGGYGTVFLARDEHLDRNVAVKAAHRSTRPDDDDSEVTPASFIDEARRIAKLNHPNIVRVLDVDRDESCAWYLVMEYIDGPSLKDALASRSLTVERIARIVAQVARAVHHAHLHGIFHRDLKPSNILLDSAGWPYVVDFGMALHVRDQRAEAGRVAGTPAYMSPEQVRGEGHRLDGRTDVWSLGVTFYEALVGERPFGSGEDSGLFDEILHKEARPLRQVNDEIPAELERICLRCVSKRMSDRYPSALDLAADLEHWLETVAHEKAGLRPTAPAAEGQAGQKADGGRRGQIVPRGLRSFVAADAHFFVELLPGPYGRDGLPESIRRWLTAFESPELPAQAVCVLYGPSGSGKSSLVRAGILPRLAPQIHYAIVDAGSSDVEGSLLAALLRIFPELPTGATLQAACAWVRHRPSNSGKVLLVIDQFEQWLHAHPTREVELLAAALRHCDGTKLQCLITVRSDFWLGATRFMEQLENPLVEGSNCGRVDLFSQRHARKVFQQFGEAYGCLPGAKRCRRSMRSFWTRRPSRSPKTDGSCLCGWRCWRR